MKNILLTLALIVILALAVRRSERRGWVTFVYPFEDGTTVTVPAGAVSPCRGLALHHPRVVHTFLRSWTADYIDLRRCRQCGLCAARVQADSIWGPIEQIDPADEAIECKEAELVVPDLPGRRILMRRYDDKPFSKKCSCESSWKIRQMKLL